MGEMERSCQIHREVLELKRTWLGLGHHDTVASMASVAFTLKHLGRKKDSLNMRSDIVKVWEEKLQDSTHPQEYRRQCLKARNDLANSHVTSGSIDEAIALRLAVLQSQQELLGNEHADTIQTMSDQARDYTAKGDYESAVLRCEETLGLQQSCLEDHHPRIRSSMKRLAKYYHKLHRERQVIEMYESLYKIQLAAIGEDSEDTLKTAKRLKKLKLTTDETRNKDPAIP
jgi:Tetratricopeptide repeat